MNTPPVPLAVTQEIERMVSKLHDDARKFENVEVLDEGQVFTVHMIVGAIYQQGYEHGLSAQMERDRQAKSRQSDRKRATVAEQLRVLR